jgi:hypothetical protein
MNAVRNRWQHEQFDPGLLGLLASPFHQARRGLRREPARLLERFSFPVEVQRKRVAEARAVAGVPLPRNENFLLDNVILARRRARPT